MYCVHRGTAEKQYYYTECSLPLQKNNRHYKENRYNVQVCYVILHRDLFLIDKNGFNNCRDFISQIHNQNSLSTYHKMLTFVKIMFHEKATAIWY